MGGVASEGYAINGPTLSSFAGCDQIKPWAISVSRFTPISYTFEVKKGFHEREK